MPPLSDDAVRALLSLRLDEGPLSDVLDRLVTIARAELTGADEVSITLVRQDRPWTAAYTGELALAADELQYERGYGPCIDAGTSGTLLRVDDMRTETRWPDYAEKVVPQGVLSSLSVPLPLQTDVVGALNCYARTAHAFEGDEQAGSATELTGHIAVAVANAVAYSATAELAAQMQEAMAGRAVIEQAKGVIMAQNRCGPDEAFAVLRSASMGRNVKLRSIAAALVESVSAPPPAAPER